MSNIFVSCYEYFKAVSLCCIKQSAVFQCLPSTLYRFDNNVAREGMAQRGGRTVVKENPHAALMSRTGPKLKAHRGCAP